MGDTDPLSMSYTPAELAERTMELSSKAAMIELLRRDIERLLNRLGYHRDSPAFFERKLEVENWLQNFLPSEIQDALMIAEAVTYISPDRIAQSIRDASQLLAKELGDDLSRTIFFQLGGSPADSGGNFLYSFRKDLRLSVDNFPPADWRSFSNWPHPIVFIDDFIGTGSQAVSFLKDKSDYIKGSVYYCALFALESGFKRVAVEGLYTKVLSPNIVRAENRAFSEVGPFASDPETCTRLRALAQKYGEKLYPKHPLGYQDSQLMLAFPHNVANNSLPILWAGPKSESVSTSFWQPLFPRIKLAPQRSLPKAEEPGQEESDLPFSLQLKRKLVERNYLPDRLVDLKFVQDQLPRLVPPDGGYECLNFVQFDDGAVLLMTKRQAFVQPPGSTIDYSGMVPHALICEISNYGTEPLYEVCLPVHVKVYEAEHKPDNSGSRAGRLLEEWDKRLPLGRLDVGADRTRTLYIVASHNFIKLELDGTVIARTAGSSLPTTFRLYGAVEGHLHESWLYPQQR